ncbi:hypothetical protein C8J57DRAFT_1268758, partial [Mycena rebaudengoi]
MPLGQSTLITVVVASSVGGVLLVVLMLCCWPRRKAPPVPLPPKQELARYRDPQPIFLAAPTPRYAADSSSSLLPDSRNGSPFQHFSRHSSLNPSESPSDDLFHTLPVGPALPLPHPSFHITPSSTSLRLRPTQTRPTYPFPRATRPSPIANYGHQTRSPSTSSRSRRQSRALSVGSSPSRRNTIRGVPHGPHSQVQIVLPTPLAFNDRISIHESPRMSMVDQWAPMAVRSAGPIPQRRSFSGELRPSPSSRSTLRPHAPTSPSTHGSLPPPVPQIPERWLPPVDPALAAPKDSQRGRPPDVQPPVSWVDGPPPVDPPSDQPRKLQKRSKSRGRINF